MERLIAQEFTPQEARDFAIKLIETAALVDQGFTLSGRLEVELCRYECPNTSRDVVKLISIKG